MSETQLVLGTIKQLCCYFNTSSTEHKIIFDTRKVKANISNHKVLHVREIVEIFLTNNSIKSRSNHLIHSKKEESQHHYRSLTMIMSIPRMADQNNIVEYEI